MRVLENFAEAMDSLRCSCALSSRRQRVTSSAEPGSSLPGDLPAYPLNRPMMTQGAAAAQGPAIIDPRPHCAAPQTARRPPGCPWTSPFKVQSRSRAGRRVRGHHHGPHSSPSGGDMGRDGPCGQDGEERVGEGGRDVGSQATGGSEAADGSLTCETCMRLAGHSGALRRPPRTLLRKSFSRAGRVRLPLNGCMEEWVNGCGMRALT